MYYNSQRITPQVTSFDRSRGTNNNPFRVQTMGGSLSNRHGGYPLSGAYPLSGVLAQMSQKITPLRQNASRQENRSPGAQFEPRLGAAPGSLASEAARYVAPSLVNGYQAAVPWAGLNDVNRRNYYG